MNSDDSISWASEQSIGHCILIRFLHPLFCNATYNPHYRVTSVRSDVLPRSKLCDILLLPESDNE